jgi:phage baseplate assembly protein W
MAGINAETGKIITDGWLHTVQSVQIILSTRFGERVERRHFGSLLPHLLGENLTPETFLRFLASIPQSLAVVELNGLAREPRFEVVRASKWNTTPETVRAGRVGITIEGIYFPRGHLGDRTPDGVRRINVFPNGSTFLLEAA